MFVVEGLRLVEEALNSDWEVGMLLMSRAIVSRGEGTRIWSAAEKRKLAIYEISREEAGKLSDTVTSQGILAVVSMKDHPPEQLWSQPSRQSIIVGLDGISDPGNLGTILRTCDWFGVDAALLGWNCAELYSPKVMRSAMGSIFHLPVLADVDLLQTTRLARKSGFQIFVTAASGETLFGGKPVPAKSMFLFGNEARGASAEIMQEADARVSIPKFGKAESLNVAIACGVILGSLRLPGGAGIAPR